MPLKAFTCGANLLWKRSSCEDVTMYLMCFEKDRERHFHLDTVGYLENRLQEKHYQWYESIERKIDREQESLTLYYKPLFLVS